MTTKIRTRSGHLLIGALLAVALLALGSLAGGRQEATAVSHITVGIDADSSTSNDPDGNGIYGSFLLSNVEDCRGVAVDEEFDFEVFVLDIVEGDNLLAFATDISYPGSLINITRSATESGVLGGVFLDANPASSIINTSQNNPDGNGILSPPDSDGAFESGAVDTGELVGETGKGILTRFTAKAMAAGVATISLDTSDINGDTIQDRGTVLTNQDGGHPGDTTGDGFFDGPYINPSITIAIGGADPDGDNIPESCGDNCPNDYNPGQLDIDGDDLGDECDEDKDGDGFTNDLEIGMGSADDDPFRTPEVCDRYIVGGGLVLSNDEDGDGLTNEGYDLDGNTIPDCLDPSADTDGDTIANTDDDDDDNDGFPDAIENWIATNSLIACADTTTNNDEWDDKWAPDITDNREVDIDDVILGFKPAFRAEEGDIEWRRRPDLDGSGNIDIDDVIKLKPYFRATCLP